MTDETTASPADTGATPATDAATGSDTHMIPKSRLDQEIEKRRALEHEMTTIADALLAKVPERLKALVPEGLTPAQQIAWFQKAEATGVFADKTQSTPVPETDNAKPKTLPHGDRDLSDLPSVQKIAHGYGQR